MCKACKLHEKKATSQTPGQVRGESWAVGGKCKMREKMETRRIYNIAIAVGKILDSRWLVEMLEIRTPKNKVPLF